MSITVGQYYISRTLLQHKQPKYVLLWILFLCTASSVHAQRFQLTSLKITGSSAALLSTNGTDVRFSAELSQDKRKITLRFPDAAIAESVNEATSYKGLIETVSARRDGRSSIVIVQLRERSGFTTTVLPYSRAVAVEAFDWDKLSPADDAYRSALLAMDNGITAQAIQMLQQAERANHPDATAHLGFLRLREERFADAKQLLLKAKQNNSTIADIYAGLSLCARKSGDDISARTYEQDFIRQTGRAPVFTNDAPLVIEQPTQQSSEPPSLALGVPERVVPVVADTSVTTAKQEAGIDSIINQQRRLKGEQPTANVEQKQTSSSPLQLLPSWMNSLMLGVGGSLVMVGILLLRGYGKWKREQLLAAAMYAQSMKQNPTPPQQQNQFTSHFASAMSGTEQQAAVAYQRSGSILNRTDDDAQPQQSSMPKQESQTNNTEKQADELFDFDEDYYRELEEKRRQRRQQPTIPDALFYQSEGSPASSLSNEPPPQQVSPSVFAQSGTQPTTDDIEQLAKRLGIDPTILASLDTQKAAQRLK